MPERLDRFTTYLCFAAGLTGLLTIVLPALLMALSGARP